MSTNRDFDRIAEAWLANGPSELADRVLEAALDEIEHTAQRRGLPAPWRLSVMSSTLKVALSAAAVLAIAVGALFVLDRASQSPAAVPTASATPTPAIITPEPSPATVTITFSDSACEATGAEALSAGQALVRSVNETSKQVTIDLWRLHPNRTYREFVDHIAIAQARIDQGLEPSAPQWVTMSTGALLETTGSEEARVTLQSGTHAITCIAFEGERAVTLLATGPIDISG